MRAARRRTLTAAILALAACTCGKTKDAPTLDASTPESGAPALDAGDEFSVAPSCLPALPPDYRPAPWVPPAPNTHACDYDEMRYEVACELDDPGRTGVCEQYPVTPACRGCVITGVGVDAGPDAASNAPGAMISDGRFLRLNIGGCVALVTDAAQDYACGAKIHAADQCVYDACAHCLDFGVASFGGCEVQARLGPCKDQDTLSTQCISDLRPLYDLSPCMPDADFRQSAEDLAIVFCSRMPASGDGG